MRKIDNLIILIYNIKACLYTDWSWHVFFFNLPHRWLYMLLAEVIIVFAAFATPNPFTPGVIVICQGAALVAVARLGRRHVLRQIMSECAKVQTILIQGVITPCMIKRVRVRLERAASKDRPVVVVINSGGGEAISAHAIITLINHHASPVKILVVDRCMSAAALIACSVPLNNRFILAGASVAIHASSHGKTRIPTAETHTSTEWLREVQQNEGGLDEWLIDNIARTTSLDPSFLEALFATGGDLYFNAENACKNGMMGTLIK